MSHTFITINKAVTAFAVVGSPEYFALLCKEITATEQELKVLLSKVGKFPNIANALKAILGES